MKFAILIVVASAAAACASSSSEKVVSARPMTAAEMQKNAVKRGDCVEARRRAAIEPDLAVDNLPELTGGPTPFTPTPLSVKADIDKNGMAFKADVVIDTLGKAIVGTLKVKETSNEWFARNLKALLPRMTFTPATLAGCKVERVYKFTTSSKPKPQL